MFKSLRSRLFLSHLLVALISLVFVGAALLVVLRGQAIVNLETYNQLHSAVGGLIEAGPAPPIPVETPPGELARLAAEAAGQSGARTVITDTRGNVLADSDPAAGGIDRIRRARPPFVQFAQGLRDYAWDERGRLWLAVPRPLPAGGPRMFLLRQRPTVLQFLRRSLLTPLAQAGLIAVVLSALLAFIVARSVARPLQRVAEGARALAQGRYDERVPAAGPSEVRSVAQSFNRMAQRVQASQQAQRDFVANVSHDLRTPLTSIQGFAQAILDGAADSPDQLKQAATVIHDEAARMRRLVDGLLDLARLDAGLKTLSPISVDVSALLVSAADKLSLRAAEKGTQLRTEIAALPPIPGDPDRLAQVFANLLDNALKYTPPGGTITVTAAQFRDVLEVVVADTGPGIPPEDLPRIFERFYQVDKARAGTPAGRGAGLGLTISKEIVEAHSGTIRADSVAGQGARFTVRLPLPKPDDTTLMRRRSG